MQPVLLLAVLAAVAAEVEDRDVHPVPRFYRYEHYLSPARLMAGLRSWTALVATLGRAKTFTSLIAAW